jgi:hypothetical protein
MCRSVDNFAEVPVHQLFAIKISNTNPNTVVTKSVNTQVCTTNLKIMQYQFKVQIFKNT